MSSKLNDAPKPLDVLCDNLFVHRPAEQTFRLLSEGISVCRDNAERLLADAEHLVRADRLSSGRFLITTAREETAKPYILLDACRLDFRKHLSVLRALCGTFYNHIAKHAYIEIQKFRSLSSMSEVMDLWKVEVKRWWPGEAESGEPDMPHDTYFDRELPLYVDFSNYSGGWIVPDNASQHAYFECLFGETPISSVREKLNALRETERLGLFAPECLAAINEVFKGNYVGERATAEFVQRLHEKVAQKIEEEKNIPTSSFFNSTIVQWPLYHCAVQGH